ncbi:hypothetical protein HDU93_004468 [Gonapodya sp. JEL0774]|nr:hypothetical protein HDU93_004468 [Gonapodya sp. JEL0774]
MDAAGGRNSGRRRAKAKPMIQEPTPAPVPKEEKKVAVPLEVYLLKNMKHENIVGFLDVWEDPRHFILVQELHGCPWDDSSKYRVPTCHGLDPLQASSLIKTAADAIASGKPLPSHLSPAITSTSQLPPSAAPAPNTIPGLCPCLVPPSLSITPPLVTTVVPKHPSTDLFECVEKLGVLTETQARYIFRQVVEAVWYLHVVCGVVHRDIKDENLVVSHTLHVKLIDMGNSAFIPAKDRPDLFFDRFYGTVQYCAPEVLCGKRYRGPEAEMWSLGVLLYTLCFSELPFADPSQTVHLRYARPRYQRSPQVIALLDRLLEKDPAKRATVEEVRDCGWWTAEL